MTGITYFAADRGRRLSRSNFVAWQGAPNTAIASADAPTSYSATSGIYCLDNTASYDGGDPQRILLQKLTLKPTAVNTGSSEFILAGFLDVINRYSSGGSTLTNGEVHKSVDSGYEARTAKGTHYFGDLTLAAASDERFCFERTIAQGILAKKQVIEINFGQDAPSNPAANVINIATQIWIEQDCSLVIHDISPSQSADPAFVVIAESIEYGHPELPALT